MWRATIHRLRVSCSMRCPHSCQLMKNRLCVHRNQLKQRPVIDNCHPTHASCHANRYDSPAMSSANPIRHISDTALWAAVYRAEESERADAVFRDSYARRLAADRVRNPRCCRSSCIETRGGRASRTKAVWESNVLLLRPRRGRSLLRRSVLLQPQGQASLHLFRRPVCQ